MVTLKDGGSRTLRVAIFVKTPGLSPVKTRLAADLGAERAAQFYQLAVAAVAEVMQQTTALYPQVLPYWAVAEPGAAQHWPDFPVTEQGSGSLGERLDTVYRALAADGSAVALIGADAPQISPEVFTDTLRALDGGASYVLGPARDGGFYLFAGQGSVPRRVWTNVRYSVGTTAKELCLGLAPLGEVAELQPLTDVDTGADLARSLTELAQLPAPLAGQARLREWIASLAKV